MKMEEKDFEPAGLIPRSIIRTVERFQQQLRPETVALGIQEFRISRYQVRVSVRYFFILLLLPLCLNWGTKNLIIKPLVGYFWNTNRTSLFLNSYQAERAFQEMRDFESQLFFEILLSNPKNLLNTNSIVSENSFSVQNIPVSYASENLPEVFPSQRWGSLASTNSGVYKPHSGYFAVGRSSEGKVHREESSNPQLVKLPSQEDSALDCTFFNRTNVPIKGIPTDIQCCNKPVAGKDSRTIIKEPTTLGSSLELDNFSIFYSPEKNSPSDQHNPVTLVKNVTLPSYFVPYPSFIKTGDTYDSGANLSAVLFQKKTVLLAEIYNQQSITALSNMFGDCVMVVSTALLLRWNAPQFTILKSFLIESFYSFNDAIKCFYIILITDFLVGFHSPRGWEIAMEMLLRHLGLPEDEEFILLFVGTFPVFLDTAFKYWIFRYLNKISPSTVATYHSMIE